MSESFAYNLFDQTTSHTNNGVSQTYGYDSEFGITSEAEPMGSLAYRLAPC